MPAISEGRNFIKDDDWELWESQETDQRKRIPPPAPEKPCPEGTLRIDLIAPDALTVGQMPLIDALCRRSSRRVYTPEPLTIEELSFLVWATQGLSDREFIDAEAPLEVKAQFRTVPSGGARHPFETYLLVRRVEGLDPGLYRYLPLEHQLGFLAPLADLGVRMDAAWGGRQMLEQAAVVFMWTVIPYRTEWRYTIVAHKIIAQDSGHVCGNLYLACEAIGAGTCAVGAYRQAATDALLEVDGEEEFTIYMAPVGKIGTR